MSIQRETSDAVSVVPIGRSIDCPAFAWEGLHVRHDLVPLTVRLAVLQSARVRVWVRLLPVHTVLLDGDHEVAVQVGGQDLVPLTVRLGAAAIRQCAGLGQRTIGTDSCCWTATMR